MHNVDWRKGTPKPASPADRGRDITAEVDHIEIDLFADQQPPGVAVAGEG